MFSPFLSGSWFDVAVRSYDVERVPGLDYALIGYRTMAADGPICHMQEWVNGRLANWKSLSSLNAADCDIVIERPIAAEYELLMGRSEQRSVGLATTKISRPEGEVNIADFLFPALPYSGEACTHASYRVSLSLSPGVALNLFVSVQDGLSRAETLSIEDDRNRSSHDVELEGRFSDLAYYITGLRRLNQCSSPPLTRGGVWPFIGMSITFNDEARRQTTRNRRTELAALVWSLTALAGEGADRWRSYLAAGTGVDAAWWPK